MSAARMSAESIREPDPLEVRIHRGAHEIGGNCVELRHGHEDHWGLALQLPTDIPVFVGEGAANILRAAQFWGSGVDLHEAGHLRDRVPFTLGPFTVTPYLADHSAYDAFSLLIEVGGRSLFYTGDIRGHGRKASAFERLLADPPCPVHAILMEGTSFRAISSDADAPELANEPASELALEMLPDVLPELSPELVSLTESDVEAQLADPLKATRGRGGGRAAARKTPAPVPADPAPASRAAAPRWRLSGTAARHAAGRARACPSPRRESGPAAKASVATPPLVRLPGQWRALAVLESFAAGTTRGCRQVVAAG